MPHPLFENDLPSALTRSLQDIADGCFDVLN
jgi:hypothetical protein